MFVAVLPRLCLVFHHIFFSCKMTIFFSAFVNRNYNSNVERPVSGTAGQGCRLPLPGPQHGGGVGSDDVGAGATASWREGCEVPRGDAPLTAPRCCVPPSTVTPSPPPGPAHGDVTFGGGAEHDLCAATTLSTPPDGLYDNVSRYRKYQQ